MVPAPLFFQPTKHLPASLLQGIIAPLVPPSSFLTYTYLNTLRSMCLAAVQLEVQHVNAHRGKAPTWAAVLGAVPHSTHACAETESRVVHRWFWEHERLS